MESKTLIKHNIFKTLIKHNIFITIAIMLFVWCFPVHAKNTVAEIEIEKLSLTLISKESSLCTISFMVVLDNRSDYKDRICIIVEGVNTEWLRLEKVNICDKIKAREKQEISDNQTFDCKKLDNIKLWSTRGGFLIY